MLHALTAPVGKTLAIGALVLALAAVARPHECDGRRLVLHAEARPNATYLTVFQNNQLWVPADMRATTTIVFTTRGNVGANCKTTDEAPACHWVGTEQLVPIDDHSFSYSYTEELIDCDPGAVQACIDTPRTGTVTIED